MRTVWALVAMMALAACSPGEQASATPDKSDAKANAPLPEDRLPEDSGPDAANRFLTSLTNPPQAGPWHPRDACIDQPGALEFREQLAAAVIARDTDALEALSAKDIVLDFGGGSGVGELKKRLGQADSGLWTALANLLPLGCAAGADGSLTMPWYFAQDIPLDDPYFGMMVKGVNVPVRAAPTADAKVIETISWDAIEVQSDPAAFAKVKLHDGRNGYIEAAKLRAIIDYRLIAERKDGAWKLTAFVAGD
ncbi:MAG: SH3 domain-containing protein [Candidatus Andeanibacterium colombiense]|uniref:SH3 domain-containing protein n=1 Tax=Candidatus Andeanibacterium colombiense TaxID=3121345 RepID=A0AAJ5XAF8_9SPHN|nr:MAG: SH3 domain-containing protein [Sphingomonadaceae bacterium]